MCLLVHELSANLEKPFMSEYGMYKTVKKAPSATGEQVNS